jgi:5-methylcytosine-specific restriction protein B
VNATPHTITAAIEQHDPHVDDNYVAAGEKERAEILARFPLSQWPSMPLERYAVGLPSTDVYCTWLEFRTTHLGSMRGGSSNKLLVYKRKRKDGWFFYPPFRDEQEAWANIRADFVRAFELAREGRFDEIDGLPALQQGPALRVKSLHLYFPNEILPITSRPHLLHFLRLFGHEVKGGGYEVVQFNRRLLESVRAVPKLAKLSTNQIERFLYRFFDPRDAQRIVKIAPGEGARYWDDCLRGGYICVGWDLVGDLREFDGKEAFSRRFGEAYGNEYNGHPPTISKKRNELWTLMELEPGDLVVANRGISEILAVGEVLDPSYAWDESRPEYKHTVRVKWDTSRACRIAPQKQWGLVTVQKLSQSQWDEILRSALKEPDSGRLAKAPAPPLEAWFEEIASEIESALERKKQVILYGPPGTGKTWIARRFALWWLLRDTRREEALLALASPTRFDAMLRELSTGELERRTWWIVANPKEWSWERLFKDRRVSYRQGRLQRNYARVQVGDLVVGYQSTPDKRVVALARVTRALSTAEGASEPTIELAPIALVREGLTWEDLSSDAVLAQSEPIRFNNQGTLFALTEVEAERLFSQLLERDPSLAPHFEGGDRVGPLTMLTFHPSYSYEDFIEGYRPVDAAGGLRLRLEDGILKRVCRQAIQRPGRYLLLVDEINRANLPKVFGELLTVLESDKRGTPVILPQSKQALSVPENVFLLGTMNTADRSIKVMDAALRRRFAFIELMPDLELFRGSDINGLALDDLMEGLNRRVAEHVGREKQIGHSFLLDRGKPVTEPEELARRFRQDILPLLQEYCQDDYRALERYLGSDLVRRESQSFDDEKLNDPSALIAALRKQFGREGSGPPA